MQTKKSLRDRLSKVCEQNKLLIEALEMFTDARSSAFPRGEMLQMHGGNGDGNYYCVYNRETIIKARNVLKKIRNLDEDA